MIVRSQKRFSKNGIIGQTFGEKDVFSLNMGHSNRSNERQSPYRIFGPNVIMCCVVSSCSRGGVWFQSLFFSCGMFSNGMSRSRPAVDPLEWKLQKFLRHDARQKYGVNVRSDGLMPLERVLRALNASSEEVQKIVDNSKKNGVPRFEMTDDWIRASSQCTIEGVDDDLLREDIETCLRSRPPPRFTKHFNKQYDRHYWHDRVSKCSEWAGIDGEFPYSWPGPADVCLLNGDPISVVTRIGESVWLLRKEIADMRRVSEFQVQLWQAETELKNENDIPDSQISCIICSVPGQRYWDKKFRHYYWHNPILGSVWEQKKNNPPDGWVHDP